MQESIEERLERLEKLLEELMNRLKNIEESLHILGISSDLVIIASRLITAFSLPATLALEASRRVIEVAKTIRGDEISQAIIEVLAECKPLTISEITRRVRVLRGTASRRIIRSRIQTLADRGIVVFIGEGKPRVTLKVCLEETR
ncbi:MAG: hypothetical protein DRN78_00470 [Thermoproteota archaeon]|nr:MAG: hypothetical protein DRN78_00470 [Candidatus Korarchaeota archaeon]